VNTKPFQKTYDADAMEWGYASGTWFRPTLGFEWRDLGSQKAGYGVWLCMRADAAGQLPIERYPVMQTRQVLLEFVRLPMGRGKGRPYQEAEDRVVRFADKYGWLGLPAVVYDPLIPAGQPGAIHAERFGVWHDEVLAMRDLWTGFEMLERWRSAGSEIARRYFADRLESGDGVHNFHYAVHEGPDAGGRFNRVVPFRSTEPAKSHQLAQTALECAAEQRLVGAVGAGVEDHRRLRYWPQTLLAAIYLHYLGELLGLPARGRGVCRNPDCGKEFTRNRPNEAYCSSECGRHAAYLRSQPRKEDQK
jgi:hypothetical protein